MGSYTPDMTAAVRHPLDHVLTPGVLRLLVLVEELGGVGAAARAAGISQPSASRTLGALERRLGYLLLRRTPLGSTLTAEGMALAAQARLVLGPYDQLTGAALDLAGASPSHLTLAASRTVGEQLVPLWLSALAVASPELRLTFRVDNSDAVVRAVRSGGVPLGFVEVATPPSGLALEVLRYDELVVIVPPGHRWEGGTVAADDLAVERLVEREPGSGTRGMLDLLAPVRLRPSAEFDSNTAIIQAVAAGLGPAVLSELAVGAAVRAGDVAAVAWRVPPPRRPLCAIWQHTLGSSRLVAGILEVARAHVGAGRAT